MIIDFTDLTLGFNDKASEKAAKIFADEIFARTGKIPEVNTGKAPVVRFAAESSFECRDSFAIGWDDKGLTLCAKGIRGLIFAIGRFLRKTVYENGKITLIKDIAGEYAPDKRIRGHQLGYRSLPNTYDAWDLDDYRRYYLDMMFFGANTCEHMPYENGHSRRNKLMKYDEEELLVLASDIADEYDLDVSLWFPNNDDETIEQAVERRAKLFERLNRVNAVFPPGGDPGDFPAPEFIERTKASSKALKSAHPEAQMWPSAQQPRSQANWGNEFIEELEKFPDEIDGVITGPNRAFPIDILRRKLPKKYPIRFYPDITHSVRCEYPVHFNRDDWHYGLATGLGRECVDPRPKEFRLLHRLTAPYTVGSVSYSEGVNDDINKMVWSDMDFDPNTPLRETLLDYARLFMPGVPAGRVADGIFALEDNWIGDPVENPGIEATLAVWQGLLNDYPSLIENWRFVCCLFRAQCDALLRRRRLFELDLVEKAKYYIAKGDIRSAKETLDTDFDDTYKKLRADINDNAERLFKLIGIQLDVEHYSAQSWERGAVIDTIDLPLTDRAWLKNRLDFADTLEQSERTAFFKGLLERNRVDGDEFYFSLAEHELDALDEKQEGELYIDFQGDKPHVNDGSIPTCMFKVFDCESFRCKLGGLTAECDYKLKVSFVDDKPQSETHTVTVNGNIIYKGNKFGGESDPEFDRRYLAPGFESAEYTIPKEYIENGCVELVIEDQLNGVMLCEFWIRKA